MVRSAAVRLLRRRLEARGFEVRRSSVARRARLLAGHGVDLVLDVGAAGGSYGRQLREHGYRGRIISFEPLAPSFEVLAEAAASDPLWDIHNIALGAESGTAELNIASNHDSSSLLPMLEAHSAAAPETRMQGSQEVKVAPLDDVVAGLVAGSRPYLKIDTQGYERPVLAGGPATVAACVGLQLELSFVPLYEGGMLIDEAVSWAYAAGFRMMGIEQGFAASDGRILQMDGIFFRDQ